MSGPWCSLIKTTFSDIMLAPSLTSRTRFQFQSLPNVVSHSSTQNIMIAIKRRREGSIATTPALSTSNGSRTSSVARSSPINLSKQGKYSQQQPNKRVTLHPPSSQLSTEASSTPSSTIRFPSRLRQNGPAHASFSSEHEADTSNREENDLLDEIIMAVDLKERGTVGCCYYVAREEKVIVPLPFTIKAADLLPSFTLLKISNLVGLRSSTLVSIAPAE